MTCSGKVFLIFYDSALGGYEIFPTIPTGPEVILFNGNYFPQFTASTFKQEIKYSSCILCCKGTHHEEFYVGVSCNL